MKLALFKDELSFSVDDGVRQGRVFSEEKGN